MKELTGQQRIYLQICSDIWKWIKEGRSASSFLCTPKGDRVLEDLEKAFNLRPGFQVENKYLAIFDAIDELAGRVDRDGIRDPYTEKQMAELTSKFDIFNSTLIGRIIAEEINRDIKK